MSRTETDATSGFSCILAGYSPDVAADWPGVDFGLLEGASASHRDMIQASWDGESPDHAMVIAQPSAYHFTIGRGPERGPRLMYRDALVEQLGVVQQAIRDGAFVIPMALCDFNVLAISSLFGPRLIASGSMDDANVLPLFDDRAALEKIEKPRLTAGLLPTILAESARMRRVLPSFVSVGVRLNTGPLSIAAELRGATAFLYDMMEAPELAQRLLSLLTELYIEVRDAIHAAAGITLHRGRIRPDVSFHAPTTGVMICDDFLSVIGRREVERFALPCYARILDHYGGGSIHSCGDTSRLWPSIGLLPNLHGFEFGQGDLVDWEAARKAFADRNLVFWDLGGEGRQYLETARAHAMRPHTFVYSQDPAHIRAWRAMEGG